MFDEYKEILCNMLDEKRYNHSVGVSAAAKEMAARFGAPLYKAELAGLIHDCAKNIPYDDLEATCKSFGYIPDEIEIKNPGLIHAPLGAKMIAVLFGIDDEEIQNAVKRHTVAGKGMTKLDKIIYLADMIEPSRQYPEVEELRELAEENLDKAFGKALDYSLMFNISKGVLIHPDTLYARNELIQERGKIHGNY